MDSRRDARVDQTVLFGVLEAFASQGVSPVRAADLALASRETGHYVPKKFVRRRLTVNADGVTGLPGVTVTERPRGRFWFS